MSSRPPVIELKNVSKTLGTKQVLKSVSLSVPPNSVFAFLGNNGEGKSTTIRIITGLISADSGIVNVLGKRLPNDSLVIRQSIGCIVDSPALYSQLSAEEFLSIGCLLKRLNKSEIDRALEVVSLKDSKLERIAHYSLGMKQRLALAFALLGKPQLLILDEPTNGLDPNGMREIRELIKQLPSAIDCTVFVSSHLLDEVEKMATHVALLKQGKVIYQNSLRALSESNRGNLTLEISCTKTVEKVLEPMKLSINNLTNNTLVIENIDKNRVATVNKVLMESGIDLLQSIYNKPSLEQWFLSENELQGQ